MKYFSDELCKAISAANHYYFKLQVITFFRTQNEDVVTIQRDYYVSVK